MKIHLAFLCPYNNQWIGWWDRKYGIYYKNLDEIFFEKYMIYVTKDKNQIQLEWREVIVTEDMIEDFCNKKNIEFIYLAGAKVSKETEDTLLENRTGLINVNFTPLYTTDPRKLNLIISMTDYWKLYWMHGKLSNSSVVYNPVDVQSWKNLWKNANGTYRVQFKWKKHIIGRIARAEPSKWHWLVLATLWKLDREKNYDYGFFFVGMPWLYRKWIQIFLSKKMQSCIHTLPEMREYWDIAEFYRSIDIFWQFAWIGESFWNVIAEAACFSVPSIVEYKWFYKNNHLNPLLYDAQIELVDHNINGIYSSKPEWVIRFLRETSGEFRKKLWENAYKKVSEIYAIEHTTKQLAKVLYRAGKEKWIYIEDHLFENIQENPDSKTLQDYQEEYGKRVALWEQFDTISAFSSLKYRYNERIWRFVEYSYLLIRKILKRYFSVDIEKS